MSISLFRRPFGRIAAALLVLATAGAASSDRREASVAPAIPDVIIEGRYAPEPIFRLWSPAELSAYETP